MPGQSGRIAIRNLKTQVEKLEKCLRDAQERVVSLNNRVVGVENAVRMILNQVVKQGDSNEKSDNTE